MTIAIDAEGAISAPSLIDADDPAAMLAAYSRMIAHQVHRWWPDVDPDDMAQEICAYVVSKPGVWAEWVDYCADDYPDEETARHAANRIRVICRRAASRYARAEMAKSVGYRPEDEAFYSLPQLRELVSHYYTAGITERPPQGREIRSSNRGDPSTAGNWIVSLLDVDRGLSRLPRKYRTRLQFRFRDMAPYSDKEIAGMVCNLAIPKGKRDRIRKHLGGTEATVTGRIRTALKRLQQKLGGESPYREFPEEKEE